MKGLIITVLLVLSIQIIGMSQTNEKDFSKYRELIVGSWKLVDIEHTSEMMDTYASFAADCTYIMSIPCDLIERSDTIHLSHQYRIESDKLIVTGPEDYRRTVYKIIKLTDTDMVLEHLEKVTYKKL